MTFPGPWPGPTQGPYHPPQYPPPQWDPPQYPPQWGPPPAAPPGWGPPGMPPYGGPPYGGPPSRRSPVTWVIAAVVAVLAVAGLAGGVWGYLHHRNEQQLADIRATVNQFAEASDTADTTKMAALMCADEAEQFTDGMEGTDDGGPIKPAKRAAVNIGEISVDGNQASVDVTRPPSPTVTLKLTREAGGWRLCNPE